MKKIASCLAMLGALTVLLPGTALAATGQDRLSAVLLPVTALAATGQDEAPLVLTMEDSIRLALRQNPFYLAEKAKEDGASAAVREAVAGFFPTLNAQGQSVLDKKVMSIVFPSLIPGQPPTKVKLDFTRAYQFSLNFSLPLFTGGRLLSRVQAGRPQPRSRPRRASGWPSRRPSSTSRRPSTACCWPGPSWA